MRPLCLSLSAFGPFADSQTIDFRRLGDNRLFLVNGPIGAGKTSLLDGLCFALYGESAGAERESQHLRSHHASPELPTEATLDLAIDGRMLRVRRRPAQERPRQRGTGTTLAKADAWLWDRTGLALEDPAEGRLLAAGIHGVDHAIADRLRFTAAEFRQVMVLPQGRFRELLVAESRDRERILSTLFQAGRYARIEAALKDQSRAMQADLSRLAERERFLLSQAEVDSASGLADRRHALQAASVEAAVALAQAIEREDLARSALETARRVDALFATLDRAQAAQDALAGEAHRQSVRQEALKAAQRAATVEPVAQAAQRARETLEQRTKARITHETALLQRQADKEHADQALLTETEREPDRARIRQSLAELELLAGHDEALAEARSDAESAQVALVKARSDETAARETVTAAATHFAKAQTDRDQLSRSASTVEIANARSADLKRGLDLLDRLERARGQLRTSDRTLAEARVREEKARAALIQAQADRDSAERAWLDGTAQSLALALVSGRPCPVCGSPEHPAPAAHARSDDGGTSIAPSTGPDRTALDTARRTLEAARKLLDTAVEARLSAGNAHNGIADQIRALTETLGPDADRPPSDLQRDADAAADALAAAMRAVNALPAAEAVLQSAADAVESAQARLETARTQAASAETEHEKARVRVDERAARLPEALQQPGAVAKATQAARKRLNALEQALADAQRSAQSANERRADAAAAVTTATDLQASAQDDHDAADAALRSALMAAGFADSAALAAARRDASAMKTLEVEIETVNERMRTAAIRLKDAQAAVADLNRPDLTTAAADHAAARDAVTAAQEAKLRLADRVRSLDAFALQITEAQAMRAEAEAAWQIAQNVADVASGRNGAHPSFQRYVLGAFLDEVLEQTNLRLNVMSRGRYLLRRALDADGRRRLVGLELEVLDSHTDRPRPVRTLSGGEGFLAALSLALGVVDAVQLQAGGIAVDTLFIDEGFGSLDADALDAAMSALIDLQSTGRLIGVVSHVAEMRERIPARLDVDRGLTGSRVRFVLP